ncbi:MAG TPA: 3-dehydroquinate synthase [Candidatus Binatia bacterium]|nr:3-dehydroquinate synthase [Candidatus Binatia bacterium]
MRALTIELGGRGYPIRIGAGLLARPGSWIETQGRPLRLVTDGHVAQRHLPALLKALPLDPAHVLELPAGEAQKTLATVETAIDWLVRTRAPRDVLLVALGGGVVGDIAGFTAAIYQRGVDFVQVPTTLLAQVDSSVGGKTGVNHPRGKNLIGAFHQPRAVIADLDTLSTLPARELRAGLAEVIKYALLGDAAFLRWLEQHVDALLALESGPLAEAVEKCCAMKARIVALDERETESSGAGPRALLNLGHTFAHAIESHAGYGEWLHGEAVAVGLCMAADLSVRMGWISGEDGARAVALVRRAGLPVQPPRTLTPDEFLDRMGLDKKVRGGRMRLVLLRSLGHAFVTGDFDPGQLRATLAAHCTAAAVTP